MLIMICDSKIQGNVEVTWVSYPWPLLITCFQSHTGVCSLQQVIKIDSRLRPLRPQKFKERALNYFFWFCLKSVFIYYFTHAQVLHFFAYLFFGIGVRHRSRGQRKYCRWGWLGTSRSDCPARHAPRFYPCRIYSFGWYRWFQIQ